MFRPPIEYLLASVRECTEVQLEDFRAALLELEFEYDDGPTGTERWIHPRWDAYDLGGLDTEQSPEQTYAFLISLRLMGAPAAITEQLPYPTEAEDDRSRTEARVPRAKRDERSDEV